MSAARRIVLVAAALAAGAGAASSCQLVAGLDWTLGDAGAVDGAVSDAPAPREAGPAGACPMEATYPGPPGGAGGGGTGPTLVFALRTIDIGDTGTTPGYDLDHICTCFDDAGPSCAGASAQVSTYCDAPGGSGNQGIDDQASKLFQLIQLPVGPSVFGSSIFSAQANSGAWSLLFQIQGYNGLPDDPQVVVALFPTNGLGDTPAWDGNDPWPVPSTAVDGGVGSPVLHSDGAYVSGGTLVATMPAVEMTLRGGGAETMSLRLSGGVVTADLVQLAGQWHLQNGVIAARWALSDVFRMLGSYRDNDGVPICTSDGPSYTIAKQAICQDADILVDGTQPRSAPCDALSIGLGFTADPAVIGPVIPPEATDGGCPPATDPANDSCGP